MPKVPPAGGKKEKRVEQQEPDQDEETNKNSVRQGDLVWGVPFKDKGGA